MKKEHDLTHDLGYKNWLDETAGEAYILGSALGEMETVMAATELCGMIASTAYDDDNFSRVIAKAMNLQSRIEILKKKYNEALFLDSFTRYEKDGSKSLYEWEYLLVHVEGRYQINMIMPEYYGKEPDSPEARSVDAVTMAVFDGFDSFEVTENSTMMESQKMDSTLVHDQNGHLVMRKLDFNHENCFKRGQLKTYYFNDFTHALEAWEKIREIISNQKTSN